MNRTATNPPPQSQDSKPTRQENATGTLVSESGNSAKNQFPNWLVSIVVYLAFLSTLWRVNLDSEPKETRVEYVTTIGEDGVRDEFIDLGDPTPLDVDSNPLAESNTPLAPKITVNSVSASSAGNGGAANGLASIGGDANVGNGDSLRAEVLRPLSTGGTGTKMDLGSEVKGVRGASVAATNDASAVDRMTQEIVHQLEKNKVLVCWLLDASQSLKSRREEVIMRFDRVYRELHSLDKDRDEALLTGIVAFGSKTTFITNQPSADQSLIRNAIRDIKDDDSGKENVFSAVRETAFKWRKHQTIGKRKMIMIVLTDEIGDDRGLADEAISQVKRNDISVYVLGPMSPFGRDRINVPWVDKPTGITLMLPTDRGPESAKSEHLNLPYWSAGPQFDIFPSGFGPYALTRLTRESGGIYFVFDDGVINGPRFNLYELLEYTPDYGPVAEYNRSLDKNPLRLAVVRAADESRGARGAPPTRFSTANMADQMKNAQNIAAATAHFVDVALVGLRAVEKYRSKETSKRWQAHYDLMMGRLLAAKVRCDEYNWALAQMRTSPQSIKDKENNAWELVGDEKIAFGVKVGQEKSKREARPSSNVKRMDAKITARAKQDAESALAYLGKVVDEHEGTPWAMMAKRELATPLGFAWKETYIPPPPKAGERPSTARRKMELDDAKRRAEAMARAPKL